ncbi:hypothetical protein [Georgenia sp. SYP-B2076]|uniref:hypothetical protein n=1 Tax=Georgenia sp. SYP-B2076 TaxID=2495881 RepID=UPI0013DEA092|nr:hypothetical protein [Georgenia sp. SYP-B2076]
MSENTSTPTNPSEEPYDPAKDPDADPGSLSSREGAEQPDQAEGEDDEAVDTGHA